MTDTIEGTAVEVEPEPVRSLVPAQPGQALVALAERPAGMIAVATALADALKNIVDRQRLYTEIRGKRYPQVEAWMTIGRLDNVVAREAEPPLRHEDGSYEAFVELVRLSDGMVIGRASALCGMADDEPWGGTPPKNGKPAQPPRAEYARRSMAVTRATSRAFRQQYSWIMALAGYEPTPADEMPDRDGQTHAPEHPVPPMREPLERRAEGLIGEVKAGSPPVDMNLRQTPGGWMYGFKLTAGRKGFQCVAEGDIAEVLANAGLTEGWTVTVFGRVESVPWKNRDGKEMPPYSRVHLERIKTPEWTLPAEDIPEALPEALFDPEEEETISAALAKVPDVA